ncbi:hypothetical protein Q5692_02195 [Microcoleus sp. C2C3]|uniref:hypothetical protein n=1 Tax=unclassified Microcoleus TaxID=2642155 RepID=UPI002FD3326F
MTSVQLLVCGLWLFDDFGLRLGDALRDSCASRACWKKQGSIYLKTNMIEVMSISPRECPRLSTLRCTSSIASYGDCSQNLHQVDFVALSVTVSQESSKVTIG